jgi:uncharacterized membrane protein YfcA
MDEVSAFVGRVDTYIINPLIGLLFALALAYFFWGLAIFILEASEPEARKKGQSMMIWGVIGLFIMASVFGILSVALNTFGLPLPPH